MAYDEGLAFRIRECLECRYSVEEKRMFGGLCFMVNNHMCCGIIGDTLMARVGPELYQACLTKSYVSEMDFTGKPMKGMVYISQEGISEDDTLKYWLDTCLSFTETLPAKKTKV